MPESSTIMIWGRFKRSRLTFTRSNVSNCNKALLAVSRWIPNSSNILRLTLTSAFLLTPAKYQSMIPRWSAFPFNRDAWQIQESGIVLTYFRFGLAIRSFSSTLKCLIAASIASWLRFICVSLMFNRFLYLLSIYLVISLITFIVIYPVPHSRVILASDMGSGLLTVKAAELF